jgi:endonuclease YncB( thermonuclease family)
MDEPKKESILNCFLAGLKNDIATRDTSVATVLKWGVLLLVAYVVLPLTIIAALWYIWAKTSWSKSKRILATVAVVAVAIWIVSLGANRKAGVAGTAGIPQPATQTQSNVEAPAAQTPVVQEEAKVTEPVPAADNLYSVVGVTDGDTIKVDIGGSIETIRLIGMDTPETVDPRKPVQCFGKESSDKAREMLGGKKVRLEADPTQGERDTYNRLLRYVYLEDGTSFDKWMIAEGYAHEYTYQSKPYKYQAEYQAAEKSAREGKKGLWADDTCKGDTVSAAVTAAATAVVGSALTSDTPKTTTSATGSTTTTSATGSTTSTSGGVVKKSVNSICHAPGTTYYNQTKNFIAFETLDACLASGGRLPKR